ncbi:type II secretion system protein N [Marinibactrum halimedae]|uniref:Type II secretion system protein N n=1 Tax=Marinibactrum halimedae TaxID=1444977 RepID=A0AA37WN83_9GAMM|nr:type II secretion system protein N [Marinibactrum halimedae]MCD9458263.1 type II secretion system protein N [Marinibactrum halimedae]GLS27110.1 hypothetical protein GCM10007877_28290 [Marinibactrum halimedae]
MEASILRNRWLWFAIVVLFLVLVINRIPAQWGAFGFTRAVPGLSLSEVNGSLWNGKAGSAQLVVQGDVYSLGQLEWKLSPFSLLTFNPCAHVSLGFQNQSTSGQICAGKNSLELTDFELSLPAALAELWFPMNLDGDFSLMISKGKLEGRQVKTLDGNLSWRGARYHDGQRWIDAGSFGATLVDDSQGGINAKVTDLGGPLLAKLDANYNPILRPNDMVGLLVKGEVGARESAHPELKRVVPMFAQVVGEPSENGYLIEWQQ